MPGYFDDITAGRASILDRLNAGEPVTPEEREGLDQLAASRQSEFRKGLRRAAYNASATTDAFIGQTLESVAPNFAARQFEKAENTLRNQPITVRPRVESFRDIGNVEEAAAYASGALGEGITSVGTMIAAGLLSRGAAFRAAPALKNAAQYAGSMAAMLPQEGGETALNLRSNPEAMANTTPGQRTALTWGRGTVNAALESIVPNLLLTNAITGTAGRIAAGARPGLANIGRKAAAGVVGEGGTEFAQELTGQYAENVAVPGTGYDINQAMEAAVRGAITGGVIGGAGGTIQTARSNIDAAAERAAENVPRGTLDAAYERLDSIIRNPEEFGVDLTNATLGGLSEVASRARAAGEAAGPAAASGMDAVAAARQRFDRAVLGKLTPENRRKYLDLTENFRLLQPTEFERLRDALDTGDPTLINEAIGDVAYQFRERVPRETLQGLKNIRDWMKKFGAGVTNAARERRAIIQSGVYNEDQVVDFRVFLQQMYPDVLAAVDNVPADSVELVKMLMTYRDTEGEISPELRAGFNMVTGQDIGEVLANARDWTGSDMKRSEVAEIMETSIASPLSSQLDTMERLLTPELREYYAEMGIPIGPGATEGEQGTIRDDEGNVMEVEKPSNTPFSKLQLVRQSTNTTSYKPNPAYSITGRLTSPDLSPEQIGMLLGAKTTQYVDKKSISTLGEATDQQIAGRVKDGAYIADFNTVDIAAQSGKPWNEAEQDGFKELFEPFVPNFEGSDRDLGIQGYRMMAAISALDTYGIEVERSDIPPALLERMGLEAEGDPLRIKVDLPVDAINEETIVQRKGGRNITLGDLTGANRKARGLEAQSQLLAELGDNPNGKLQLLKKGTGLRELALARAGTEEEFFQRLTESARYAAMSEEEQQKALDDMREGYANRIIRKARELSLTINALSNGLYGYAAQQEANKGNDLTELKGKELTDKINSYAEKFAANTAYRLNNSEARERASYNHNQLKDGLRNELFTPDDIRNYIEALGPFVRGSSVPAPYTIEALRAQEAREAQIELFDEETLPPPDEFQALDWARQMKLEFDDTNDLRETLIEFENGYLAQHELGRALFADETGEGTDTADLQFDAEMKGQQGETRLRQRGIGQQNDAAVAAERAQAQQDYEDRLQREYEQEIAEDREIMRREEDREFERTLNEEIAQQQLERDIEEANAQPEAVRLENEEIANVIREEGTFQQRLQLAASEIEIEDLRNAELEREGITIEEAEAINTMVEEALDQLVDAQVNRYTETLRDGSATLADNEIRQRAVNNWANRYLDKGMVVRVVEIDSENQDLAAFARERLRRDITVTAGFALPASQIDVLGDGTNFIFVPKGNENLSSLSIVAHEFGHIIEHEILDNSDVDTRVKLEDMFRQSVAKDITNTMSATRMFQKRKDLVKAVNDGTMTPKQALAEARESTLEAMNEDETYAEYVMSFTEWFAENFARYAISDSGVFSQADKGVKAHLDRIIAKLKRFYNEVVKKNFTPNQSFVEYIESLGQRPQQPAAETTQQRIERIQAERKAQQTEETPPNAEPPPPPPPPPPPSGEQPPPPSPPSGGYTEAQQRILDIVRKMLGGRAEVKFNQKLKEGIAAEWVELLGKGLAETRAGLKAIANKRRAEIRARQEREAATPQDIADGKVDPRTPAQIQASIDNLMEQERAYKDDLAVRGTIRIAAGMEEQAGVAEHEILHAAFDIFFGDNNASDRKVLTTAFTRGVLARRLQNYFRDNAEVLSVIDPTSENFNAEEAAAYAFQVYLHDPGALQLGQKVDGIFHTLLRALQRIVGYVTYEARAQAIFDDLASGRRDERGVSILRNNPHIEKSMLERSQEFARNAGKGVMHIYDAIFTSAYSRLARSGNPAMAQIARLGYNETGEGGDGMIQRMRHMTTQWSNRMKEALHGLDANELYQLNQAMILGDELTGTKMRTAQQRLQKILGEVYDYQVAAGISDLKFRKEYFPMIWSAEKVEANPAGFLEMLEKYEEEFKGTMKTPNEILQSIISYEDRGHEFQGVFGANGEPVADSSRRRALGFIEREDRLEFMEDNIVETMAHYLNQAVRHAEYVRAYGHNGVQLTRLMDEMQTVYKASPDDIRLTKDYIDGLMGNKEVGMSRELKDLYGAAVTYQNVRLLPLSVFSSLVDPLGIAVRTGDMKSAWDAFTYSMRNLFVDWRNEWTPEQWEKYAEDMGIIDMSGTIKSIDKIYTGVTLRGKTREINDGFFKWNLLNGWVRNNHIMATKAAQLFIRRSAEGMFGEKRSAENLQEVGLRPEDVIYDEGLGRIRSTAPEILGYETATEMELQASAEEIKAAREQADRIQAAIHKIVRQSLIQPSSAEMPGWMSNPYLAPIAHLKTFVFGFNKTILQRLLYEAQRGNYSPLLYATAYVPGMIAADFVKGFAGNGGDEPDWKKNWDMGDYIGYGVHRSGLTGIGQFFTDMHNDVTRGGGGWESLAGPTIEQGLDLMRAMGAKTSQPTQTWMVNALPVNDLYDQWLREY